MPRISPSRSAVLPGVLLTLSVLSPVCLRSGEAADAGSDNGLCRRLWEDHLEAVKDSRPELVAFTKDAVLVYPDLAELRGREAIQAHLVKALAGQKVLDVGFKLERCEVVAGRAYTFGIVADQVQEGAAPPVKRHTRFATVWEQQPDRNWQIAHMLVNYRKP
jgi:ketosteroid isomerase-like protein